MSTVQILRGRFPRASADIRRFGAAASRPLDEAGRIGWFAIIGVRDMVWAFARYRKSGGMHSGVLPDFFIGAQASIAQIPLLTRDITRYRTYFPTVTLIAPAAGSMP